MLINEAKYLELYENGDLKKNRICQEIIQKKQMTKNALKIEKSLTFENDSEKNWEIAEENHKKTNKMREFWILTKNELDKKNFDKKSKNFIVLKKKKKNS